MNIILFQNKTKMFCFLGISLITIYELFTYSFYVYFMMNNDSYYRAMIFYSIFLILFTLFIISTWEIFKSEPGYLTNEQTLKDEEEKSIIIDQTYRVNKKKIFFKNLIQKRKKNWWKKIFGKEKLKDNLEAKISKKDFDFYESLTLRDLEHELETCYVENSNKKLYCFKCEIIKNERSYHCSRCKKCVSKLDHHCYIIGQCVGEKNMEYFIRFAFYCFLGTFVICIDEIIFYYLFQSVRKYSDYGIDKMFLVLLLTSLFICIFSGLIFFYTLRNISRNITGIEDRNIYFEYRNPFSKGLKKNFEIVFKNLKIKNILLPSILKEIK